MRLFVLAMALLMPTLASSQVFKCTEKGVVTYSERPCAHDAKAVDIKVYQPTPAERMAAIERAQTDREDAAVADLRKYRTPSAESAASSVNSMNQAVRSARRANTCDWFNGLIRESQQTLLGLTNPALRAAEEKRLKRLEGDAATACLPRGYP